MGKEVTLKQIGDYLKSIGVDYELQGNEEEMVVGFSSVARYQDNTLTWVKSSKNLCETSCVISMCVVQKGVDIDAKAKIISHNSKAVFWSIIEKFWRGECQRTDLIGQGTVIGEDVRFGENVRIGCNCSIIGNICIGNGVTIGDNVVIKNKVIIGDNCEIQSSSVIGEDGFGYFEDELHVKTMIKHFGGVVIGDNVFVGSHTNIARGTIEDTIIKNGVKIAPSTHIGHNNYIGENAVVICSECFGSVEIGENAYISSGVIRNQTKIGDNVIVGMGSVVTKDIEKNKVVIGIPAKVIRENNGNEEL